MKGKRWGLYPNNDDSRRCGYVLLRLFEEQQLAATKEVVSASVLTGGGNCKLSLSSESFVVSASVLELLPLLLTLFLLALVSVQALLQGFVLTWRDAF
jgi:hypothetical protein